LLAERIHGVPVVDGDGRLVGVVSQTDLLNWHFHSAVDGVSFYQDSGERPPRGLRFSDIRTATVEELMSPIVHCVRPDQEVTLAAARMIDRRIHRLIVVNDDAQVLGVVSAADLLRAIPEIEDALERVRRERIHRPERPAT
jgi:CBS-domain-containing membrane protein